MLFLFSTIFLSGCSSTTKAHLESVKLALANNDAEVSMADVVKSNADLMLVRYGDRDTAVVALAYIENDLYKWISGDKVVLTLHQGVITRTKGVDNDLLYTSNLPQNPLLNITALKPEWYRTVDIENSSYGMPVMSYWHSAGSQSMTILGAEFTTTKIVEDVEIMPDHQYINTHTEWQNTYLFDPDSGQMLFSKQRNLYTGEEITMSYLSRAARLIIEAQRQTRDKL
jgi:hypothetical protein